MAEKRRAITVQLGSTRELFDEGEQRHRSGVQRRTPATKDAPLVLLVDHDGVRRELVAQMLDRIYRVREAEDAPTAIALSAQEIPDAVLTAATVEDTSGERLSRLLGLALGGKAPPVVVLVDEAPEGGSAADVVCIDRPGDAISLVATLESAIERAKAESEPQD